MPQSVRISREVRQGCSLSPTVFKICTNEILTDRNTDNTKGIQLTRNEVKGLLFADNQVIIAGYETLLHKSVHNLESVISTYGLTISISKTSSGISRNRPR
jgi:hypothetical protein